MSSESPTVFTMPPSAPFQDALAKALSADPTLGGTLGSDVALTDITLLVPTRRAVRGLTEAFLRANDGRPMLLPRIQPLGEVEEDELSLLAGIEAEPGGAGAQLEIPPAIPALERHLTLATLIEAWRNRADNLDLVGPLNAPQASALAADLGRFLDLAETEEVELSALKDLVPDTYAQNWQLTLEFLQIITQFWPDILKERGAIDPAARRKALLNAQCEAWQKNPPKGPVIAAGSTGSIKAVARLLATIAHLPQGALVLPGLDQCLDVESWEQLGPSHPQYGLKELLDKLNVERADVPLWPGTQIDPTTPDGARDQARETILSELMRPAETTDQWQQSVVALKPIADKALQGIRFIQASSPREEATAIALLLREVLETPGKTAALITPDRNLARRVAAELSRWEVEIDDSAGTPLNETGPMVFLRLLAEALAEGLAPVPLLALLKHPMAALGMAPADLRDLARLLEREILRGPRPAPGIAGLRQAVEGELVQRVQRNPDAAPAFEAPLRGLITQLEEALGSLLGLYETTPSPELSGHELIQAHIQVAERFATSDETPGAERLWWGEAGETAAQFFGALLEADDKLANLTPQLFARYIETLALGKMVRPRYGKHPRLFIWGPLEARLQRADVMVLGELTEGVWPQRADVDPWLSRPMRHDLTMEPPERRIGLSAHDFAQALAAPIVYITRADKLDGAPTVASRWLLRLDSLLTGLGTSRDALAEPKWIDWAKAMDIPPPVSAAERPVPRPPLDARPAQFSVTEIETLMRDPYAIYARKVLRLRALRDLDENADAAEHGTLIHAVMESFTKAYPTHLPQNPQDELRRIGDEVFQTAPDRPAVKAIWWPRFEQMVPWIIETFEDPRRLGLTRVHSEIRGELELYAGARTHKLTGVADRIEQRDDGTLAILDYKTGKPPSKKQVEAGLSPQLALQAAIADQGGFEGLERAEVSEISYVQLKGGEAAGDFKKISSSPQDLIEEIWGGLIELLTLYESETTPYVSRLRPELIRFALDFDHLARVKEWSVQEEGSE